MTDSSFRINEMELLYLRRLVEEQIDYLERSISKNRRLAEGYYRGTDTFDKKIALAESELSVMIDMKQRLNDTLAYMELH